jgi:hypothetical protein
MYAHSQPLVVMFTVETRPLLVIMWLSNCNIQESVKMVHEISQFEIPDRQLLATNAQSKAGMWADIGEAKITRTIFGRAKVRVIRERDKKRRIWLLTILAVMVVAAAAWQGWIALQQSEMLVLTPPISERIRVSAPVFQPEDIAAAPASARNRQKTPTEIVLDSMATRRPPPPQQPLGLKAPKQTAAKPVEAQPLTASKPQTAPLAANNNSSKNQSDMQQPAQLSAPRQPAAPADVMPPVTQPAANKPADVAPPAEPSIKEDTSTLSPAGNNQPTDPVKVQP